MSLVAVPNSTQARQAYVAILDSIGGVKEARQQVLAAEDALEVTISRSLRNAPSLISCLYWEHDIKIGQLCAATGMTQTEMRQRIDLEKFEVTCACGDLFAVVCRTTTHRRQVLDRQFSCLACNPRGAYGWPTRLPGRRDLARVAELRAMPVQEYLRTQEWRDTRERMLFHFHRSCQICSSKYRVQVHHNTYDRFGSEQPRDLLVVCAECHARHHKDGRLGLRR